MRKHYMQGVAGGTVGVCFMGVCVAISSLSPTDPLLLLLFVTPFLPGILAIAAIPFLFDKRKDYKGVIDSPFVICFLTSIFAFVSVVFVVGWLDTFSSGSVTGSNILVRGLSYSLGFLALGTAFSSMFTKLLAK